MVWFWRKRTEKIIRKKFKKTRLDLVHFEADPFFESRFDPFLLLTCIEHSWLWSNQTGWSVCLSACLSVRVANLYRPKWEERRSLSVVFACLLAGWQHHPHHRCSTWDRPWRVDGRRRTLSKPGTNKKIINHFDIAWYTYSFVYVIEHASFVRSFLPSLQNRWQVDQNLT